MRDRWLEMNDDYDVENVKCCECEETQRDLEGAQDYFEKIVELLYTKDHVNVWALDDAMQELSGYLGVKMKVDHLPPVVRMNALGQELYNITSAKIKDGAK